MRLSCPQCGTEGNLDESRLPAGGAHVRCPQCQHRIFVAPPAAAESGPGALCQLCQRPFPEREMLAVEGGHVCAGCKPDYVQLLRIGLTRPGAQRYAGFWIRFAAKFIDGLATAIVSGILVMPLQLLFGSRLADGGEADFGGLFLSLGLQWSIQLAIPAVYTTWFLGRFQATPGKMACGLKVIRPGGELLSYKRALGRHFAEFVSSLILLVGYLMAAFDEEKRTLHDRICDTRVVHGR